MEAVLIEAGDASPEPVEDEIVSLQPHRGQWGAMLARTAAALDVAPPDAAPESPGSNGERAAPPARPGGGAAAIAAWTGLAGVSGLVALASSHPDLVGWRPAALAVSAAAACVPAAFCALHAAAAGGRPGEASFPGGEASPPGSGAVKRALARARGAGRADRRVEQARSRAVKRALADIAARERRLAGRAAPAEGGARGPATEVTPAAVPPRPAAVPEAAEAPWSMPREITEALADLEARERLHAERSAADRRAAPAAASGDARPAAPRTRRHVRIKPRATRTSIATQDGRRLHAVVLDVSQSGVAIEGNLPGLWIGSMVTVGSRRAKAVRTLPRGMAFEFSTPVPAEALTADFVL